MPDSLTMLGLPINCIIAHQIQHTRYRCAEIEDEFFGWFDESSANHFVLHTDGVQCNAAGKFEKSICLLVCSAMLQVSSKNLFACERDSPRCFSIHIFSIHEYFHEIRFSEYLD